MNLTVRLASGLESLSDEERRRGIAYFVSQQQDDGGFCGRAAGSDLYYTAFALRGLAILGCEDQTVTLQAADYLRGQLQRSVSVIDLISLVFAARLLESWTGEEVFASATPEWQQSVAGLLESLRRPDGGYAKTDEGRASSTYQTFLIALTYELLDQTLPQPAAAANFLLGQQRDDGGFVEIGVMRRSGTNPTAAAIGGLLVLEPLTGEHLLSPELKEDVAEFLLDNITDEGGMRANTQIPIADLLSSYTGLQTVRDLGAWQEVDLAAAQRFVDSLQQSTGGYLAAAWDEVTDVEYSFYGSALRGLLMANE
ncbi:MAG: prenyltransferase/squalene oxidase repeat-containing protein [Planctomycetota bacterium]